MSRRLSDEEDEYDDRPDRSEFAPDPEPCDGSGEVHFNKSWGKEPWNDDSHPCPGCANCEPDDENEDDA